MDKLRDRVDSMIIELAALSCDPEYSSLKEQISDGIAALQSILDCSPYPAQLPSTDSSCFHMVLSVDGHSYTVQKFTGFDDEKDIVIPTTYLSKPVTSIAAEAFRDCKQITSVHLHQQITVIGSGAFEGCSALKCIDGTENVRFVGNKAFYGCGNLRRIEFTRHLSILGEEAFAHSGIEQFTVPEKVLFLPEGCFSMCPKLSSVTLRDGLSYIGAKAFAHCNSLVSIELPYSVQQIGNEAFVNCNSLRELKVHSMNAIIGDKVFTKTKIWRPDLRYNPRTIYSALDNLNVLCFPGSTVQTYCREHNLSCSRLVGDCSYPTFTPVGMNTTVLVRFDHQVKDDITKAFSMYDIVVEELPDRRYYGNPVQTYMWIYPESSNEVETTLATYIRNKMYPSMSSYRAFSIKSICSITA